MKPKEFHIWNFPEDKIRILFKNPNKFVQIAISHFGNRKKLGVFLKIQSTEIYNWTKYNIYIPLKYVKLMVKEIGLNWIDVERNISSYKGVNTSAPIFNPKLPIKESPEIFSVITHIICDGSINKNGIPIYTNSSKELIDNLDYTLKKIFGDFKSGLYFGSGTNRNCYQYTFPKLMTELLEHFYQINLYKKKEIPKVIFESPNKFSTAVIRAFADDEGTVDLNWRIGFSSKDRELLLDLIRLFKEKLRFEHLTDIMEKDEKYYCFYVNPMEIERYQKEIGFSHPDKRIKLSNIVEYRKGSHGRRASGETREKLLKLLNDKVLSTYDLIKVLKINKSNINMQMKKLITQGIIVQHHKIGQTVFWTRRY
jgi:biotin operon repressor